MYETRECAAETETPSSSIASCCPVVCVCVCMKLQKQFFPVHWAAGSLAINNPKEKAYILSLAFSLTLFLCALTVGCWHGRTSCVPFAITIGEAQASECKKKYLRKIYWLDLTLCQAIYFIIIGNSSATISSEPEHYIRFNISEYRYDGIRIITVYNIFGDARVRILELLLFYGCVGEPHTSTRK